MAHGAMLFSQWPSSKAVVVGFLISIFDNIRAFDNLRTKMKIQCNPSIKIVHHHHHRHCNLSSGAGGTLLLSSMARALLWHSFGPIVFRTRAMPDGHFKCAIFAPSQTANDHNLLSHLSFESNEIDSNK